MTTPRCPECRNVIASDDVNVAADVAFCRSCNLAHKLSRLAETVDLPPNLDLLGPPAGAWFRTDATGTAIGATHRSLGMALGALAISLFWNGIVSVFVLVAIAATLSNMGVALPEWFPAPKMNGGDMGVGMTIFLWIFLMPFIAIGLGMIMAFLSSLFGRTELSIRNGEVVLYRGIGPFGYRRRFAASETKDVRIEDRKWRDSDGDSRRKTVIVIETRAGKLIKFGTQLTEDRRKFVAAAARKALVRM